jgi:hypothetical protein
VGDCSPAAPPPLGAALPTEVTLSKKFVFIFVFYVNSYQTSVTGMRAVLWTYTIKLPSIMSKNLEVSELFGWHFSNKKE